MKVFDRVKCKGFYKKVWDGIWIGLDKNNLTASKMNSNLCGDAIEEDDVDCVEKTYYEHVNRNFSGVIVGFKDLVVKGYLDVILQDEVDVGVGVIPQKFYVDKRPKDIVKCAIVYYADNKKHFVPLDDIVQVLAEMQKG